MGCATVIRVRTAPFLDPGQGSRRKNALRSDPFAVSSLSVTAPPPPATPPFDTRLRDAVSLAAALVALTKPRLAFFSVLTAMTAYGTGTRATFTAHALLTLLGTTLAAAGALSLNQWWERRTDALMRRTRQRPLPLGQLSPFFALSWSLSLSAAGVVLLATFINLSSAAFAAATILIYGLVYTPLKRRTRWATEIGSISGALPPLLGAAAADNLSSPHAWILTAVLLLWQMPHFFAIGWMHRADYRAAGFPLLPATDSTGRRTALWSFGYTVALLVVSVSAWSLEDVGAVYGGTALVAGGWLLARAGRFLFSPHSRDPAARRLFAATILYLPVVLVALLIDRF